MHMVLKDMDGVVGVDLHKPWPPGSPSISPAPAPYATVSPLIGLGVTAKFTPTVLVMGGFKCICVQSDTGPMIAHLGTPSITLPIDMAASASKSYFANPTVMVRDQTKSSANLAVALAMVTNPNLDCGSPMPTPTGTALAPGTVVTSLSIGAVVAGIVQMAGDAVIQAGLQRFMGGAGAGAKTLANRLGSRMFASRAGRAALRVFGPRGAAALQAASRGLQRAFSTAGNVLDTQAGGYIASLFVGSPLGADSQTIFGIPSAYGTANNAANEYFSSSATPLYPGRI
ncbi:MAG: hypothetical protein ACOCYN_04590 [Planctomycetota bacterium]